MRRRKIFARLRVFCRARLHDNQATANAPLIQSVDPSLIATTPAAVILRHAAVAFSPNRRRENGLRSR
jgi:hypothetical protein